MCGFAGIVDFSTRAIHEVTLARMVHTLTHRGPDERGLMIDGACGLAHRRLSIVDLASSQQPMTPDDCNVSLAYNGELYNYLELRRALIQCGVRLQTHGDTEVLLRWIARDWAAALPRFDGMFAFAAWDRQARRLLLGRDPMGEKPLFYATPRHDLIVFASEIKALLEHPEVESEIDSDALRQSLRFRAVYGSRTLYRGIRQVPPGCSLQFDDSGSRLMSHFDLIAEVNAAQLEMAKESAVDLIHRGRELLSTAVRERLMADVPLGLFLSGGVDSSLIAATMRQHDPQCVVRTFSVGFEGDPNSELGHAQTVADAVQSIHTAITVGPDEFVERLPALSYHRDGPVSEPADVAIAALSRVAKEHVKVVLSGEGADEAFGGYPKYSFAGLPTPARWPFMLLGADRVARLAARAGLDHRRALVASRSLCLPRECEQLAQWFSYFDCTELTELLPGLEWSGPAWECTIAEQQSALQRARGFTRVGRMQAVDCLAWLPGNLLERGDRMTMSEGLEVRPPFLDKQLVRFGLALPDRLKVRGRTTKWIVRQWAERDLPRAIGRRPKWGFRVPLAHWFRSSLREMLHDYVSAAGGLCSTYGNPKSIQRLLARHDSGEIDANLALWGLLTAEVWFQGQRATSRRSIGTEPASTLVPSTSSN